MMAGRVDAPSPSRDRFFHLAEAPRGARARLLESDERHAQRVLRLQPGDALAGGDGLGRAWPLRVASAGRGGLELEVAGEPWSVPAPGEPGSRAPRVEVLLALPRGGRSEAALERLTQLGVWSVSPLASERVQGHRRDVGPERAERCRRVLREACKQCRRLWTPSFGEPLAAADLPGRAGRSELLVLDPDGAVDLLDWARAHPGAGGAARPVTVVVGPEGGLTQAESAQLAAAGATAVRVGPHVLRIETAAEAALALLVAALGPGF
jgi:16S rRNA (uracil1498-N3)-methyltransferase